MELKEWVRVARKSAGLTQEQLGEKLGRTKANIGHWETGKHDPSYDQIRRISEITGHPMPGAPATAPATPQVGSHGQDVGPPEDFQLRAPRPVYVCGTCQGGMPERIWEGDWLEGATEYAEVSTADDKAFLCRVVGESMAPRYHPGEYVLIEPGTEPDLEDDVLVRLADGSTMLKRLLSRRGGWRFGSYGSSEVLNFRPEEVTWVYYVAHAVPARRIKVRGEAPRLTTYTGPERRRREVPVEVDLRTRGWHYNTEGREPPPRISIAEQIAKKRSAA